MESNTTLGRQLLRQFGLENLRFRSKSATFRFRQALSGLPVPPAELVHLVAGTTNPFWFLESGRLAAASIRAILEKNGVPLESLQTLLDFGCGCGRVIRFWHGTPLQVYGIDYNPALIGWCKQNLRFASFQQNRLAPPLDFPNDTFGLVYALSVFTHLDENLQHVWMRELHRVIRSGGYLVLSLHGASYMGQLDDAEQECFRQGEMLAQVSGSVGSNLLGAYHPEPYVSTQLADGFDLIEFVAQGAKGNPTQDLYLLHKR